MNAFILVLGGAHSARGRAALVAGLQSLLCLCMLTTSGAVCSVVSDLRMEAGVLLLALLDGLALRAQGVLEAPRALLQVAPLGGVCLLLPLQPLLRHALHAGSAKGSAGQSPSSLPRYSHSMHAVRAQL